MRPSSCRPVRPAPGRTVLALLLVVGPAELPATILDELEAVGAEVAAPRVRFSGMSDARYIDGDPAPTPHNLNNQPPTGGVSTFAALRLHLFAEADIGTRSLLFLKASAGAADQKRFVLDAMALTTRLGGAGPTLTVGRFLNNFARFPTRFLPAHNPLIGFPLLYSYRTALQAGQVPASAADLTGQAGRGLASRFTGYGAAAAGLRPIQDDWFITGLQISQGWDRVRVDVSIHNEPLSDVAFLDTTDARTVTGHLRYQPTTALGLGVSVSDGAYLTPAIHANPAVADVRIGDHRQRALGLDGDYVSGHFALHTEILLNRWDSPRIPEPVRLTGYFVEPTYRILPGLTLALRYGQLLFHDITGPAGPTSWESDVSRVEAGVAWAVERDFLTKCTYQWNRTRTATGIDPGDDVIQVQAVASW